MKPWQEPMLDRLISYLKPIEDVLGLVLFGSLSQDATHSDSWSDLDLLLVVKNDHIDKFFPTVAWLAPLGKLYTYSQSSDAFKGTTRVCFENFNRIDFVIATEQNLADVNQWASLPFFSGTRILFSRSRILDEIARQEFVPPKGASATQEQFLEMVRDFRFKSMLAVYKLVRNDLLIALHLALDLIRDCSVLGMMLRDRTTGTNIHKHGGMGNQLVAELERTQKPFTAMGILNSIQASNEVFEKLACEWSSDYQENRQPLLDWIEKAKVEISNH